MDDLLKKDLGCLRSGDLKKCGELICEICRDLYTSGWVTGTGGGITIRSGDAIVIAPSGVQKERMELHHLFVMSLITREYMRMPALRLKPSQCTPLFLAVYTLRDAYACIHTHSQEAILLSTLFADSDHFSATGFEVLSYIPKGSKNNGFHKPTDKIKIPFINNTAHESDLHDSLQEAINLYPDTCAVIVRDHGIYCWGDTWQDTKMNTEAVEFLFQAYLRRRRLQKPE
ncbi:Methylthioribulose-1-phosphate dehydratase [Schizosaccharomyces pombe]